MKTKSPLVFRLEPELEARLVKCAEELGLKKYTLGLMAIEAAVKAIEENGYSLVLPVKFEVEKIPALRAGKASEQISSRQGRQEAREVLKQGLAKKTGGPT